MSTLTIRQSTETDIPLLIANGLDERGIRTPGTYVYLCYEKNKLVGIASGHSDTSERSAKNTTPRTCYSDYTKSLLAGRWDIFLALLEREAQNGLDTGHAWATGTIPVDRQCTNILPTGSLVTELETRVGLRFRDYGFDTVKEAVAAKQIVMDQPHELAALKARLTQALDMMGCKRIWINA